MLTSMLDNENFQIWLIIGWQQVNRQSEPSLENASQLKWILTWIWPFRMLKENICINFNYDKNR